MRWSHVCAGEERCILRKSAFCTLDLTERRILRVRSHGKAHSVLIDSRKGALCDFQIAQNAPFRHAAAPGRCGATARQAAGHYGKWSNWANALEQPPASLRGGLCQSPQISVRSLASRKSAFCTRRLTERHILAAGLTERRTLPHPIIKTHSLTALGTAECVFSVTFRNHPDCIALSRHLRNPLTAPSHV